MNWLEASLGWTKLPYTPELGKQAVDLCIQLSSTGIGVKEARAVLMMADEIIRKTEYWSTEHIDTDLLHHPEKYISKCEVRNAIGDIDGINSGDTVQTYDIIKRLIRLCEEDTERTGHMRATKSNQPEGGSFVSKANIRREAQLDD